MSNPSTAASKRSPVQRSLAAVSQRSPNAEVAEEIPTAAK
jgi:hypothetical protein